MYPSPMELQTVIIATPAQRTVKATKMIGYISKTHEKVNALVQTAQQHGVDPSRVETVSTAVELV
jgi:transcription initiation factor TFIIH subunit 1